MIKRLLIANRGEIAVRIAYAAREMGISPVGIYSESDADALHVKVVDQAICIGPAAASESYLNIDAVIAAAKMLKADAVHPGYGFLSERALFARAVLDAGLTFVGPSPEAMMAMGSKGEAKLLVRKEAVPLIPGYEGEDQSPARLHREATLLGTPLLIKASAGGGGRGMRIVTDMAEFGETLESAKREARAAFGDESVLLEKYLEDPRHIEIQVLADSHGNVIHLGERECSIQRRYQKIIEEAPSTAISERLRIEMGQAAARVARAVHYLNAGTVEFMLDSDGSYYFLEMNTRLQVEHPITELVYGIDLVHWQLRIAQGERLTVEQSEIAPRGWAIEARINAEDPYNNMLPSTGTIARWIPPQAPGVRVDSGAESGSTISVHYDPMLAKLIVWAADRPSAINRMRCALADFKISGVQSNIPLLSWIMDHDAFRQGKITTSFLTEYFTPSTLSMDRASPESFILAIAALLDTGFTPWRTGHVGIPLRLNDGGKDRIVEATATDNPLQWELSGDLNGTLTIRDNHRQTEATLDGESIGGIVERNENELLVFHENGKRTRFELSQPPLIQLASQSRSGSIGRVTSPMPGKIIKIAIKPGDNLGEHDLLFILESMKMEHRIESPRAGTIKELFVSEGTTIASGSSLAEFE